jgi:hypothetical protein
VTDGPDQEYLHDAMHPAYWCYDRVLRLMLAEREATCDNSRLDELWAGALDGWRSVAVEDAKAAGRNDPCPCGLEHDGRPLKWKNCHGRPSLDAEALQVEFHQRALVPFPAPHA